MIYFLLCWKLTFFCESHPLLEFHGTYSEHITILSGQLTTECHGGNLHADEDEVQHNPEHHGNNLHAEEGGYIVQLNPEYHGNHLHEEEGKDQVKLNPELHNCHLQGGGGEDQVQLPLEQYVDHLQATMVITFMQKKMSK